MMNTMRYAFVFTVFFIGTMSLSYAQFDSQNAVNHDPAQKARPTATDFTNEITGVIGDPGHPDAVKKSQAFFKSDKKVKFYMASWCPYCKRMENFLKESNIPYDKFDVEKDAEGRRVFKELRARGVPVMVVGETVIRGFDPAATKEAWEEWTKES